MEKKLERRRNMIQTAKRLFAEYGFEQTTMQKIADEANVGVATLFRYFPKKEHLIIEVVKEVIERQVPHFEKIAASDKSGIEKIDEVLTSYISYISKENNDSTKLLEAFDLYVAFKPIEKALLEEINRSYGKIGHLIRVIIEEGQRDGSIRLTLSEDVSDASTLLNIFGTAVKKYSLYSILQEDMIVPIPRKNDLTAMKNILLSHFEQEKRPSD